MAIEQSEGHDGSPPNDTRPARTKEQNEHGMRETGFKYFLDDREKRKFLEFSGISRQSSGGRGGWQKSGGEKEYGIDFRAIQNPVTKEVYVGVTIMEREAGGGSSTDDFGRDFAGGRIGHVITYPEGITPSEALDKAESDMGEFFTSVGLVRKES